MDYTTSIAADWAQHTYYDEAESPQAIATFWSDASPFRQLFSLLNLERTVELACGHGRHSQQILGQFQELLLLDVNATNIEFCAERFKNVRNLTCRVNEGSTLVGVPDSWATAVFCYDAMVHFEASDVLSYVADIARALAPGGRALLHHSNLTNNPGEPYTSNPHHRNFMSVEIVSHFAQRAGLTVMEQRVLNWGGASNFAMGIDAVTLLERPAATEATSG